MPVILAITNAKGGTGKTTSAVNIAAELASRGHRTLLGDLDQQAHSTKSLVRGGIKGPTVGQALLGNIAAHAIIVETGLTGLHLLPASLQLAGEAEQLYTLDNYQGRLAELLKQVGGEYDFIVLDCPPAMGTMTYMALASATAYVVPCEPELFAFDGLKTLVGLANGVQSRDNPGLKMAGVFFIKYNRNDRNTLHQDIVAAAEHVYEDKVLPSIRRDKNLAQAQRAAQPTLLYSPQTNGVADYKALTTAILDQLK